MNTNGICALPFRSFVTALNAPRSKLARNLAITDRYLMLFKKVNHYWTMVVWADQDTISAYTNCSDTSLVNIYASFCFHERGTTFLFCCGGTKSFKSLSQNNVSGGKLTRHTGAKRHKGDGGHFIPQTSRASEVWREVADKRRHKADHNDRAEESDPPP